MKTHKGAAKRFRVGARGRVKVSSSCTNHLKSNKNAKRRRRLRRGTVISGTFAKMMRRFVGAD